MTGLNLVANPEPLSHMIPLHSPDDRGLWMSQILLELGELSGEATRSPYLASAIPQPDSVSAVISFKKVFSFSGI